MRAHTEQQLEKLRSQACYQKLVSSKGKTLDNWNWQAKETMLLDSKSTRSAENPEEIPQIGLGLEENDLDSGFLEKELEMIDEQIRAERKVDLKIK